MDQEYFKNLQNLAKKLAQDVHGNTLISTADLIPIVQDIVNILAKWKSEFTSSNKETTGTVNLAIKTFTEETQAIRGDMEERGKEIEAELLKRLASSLENFQKIVQDALSKKPLDGLPGKDADEKAIEERVLGRIKIPEPVEPYTAIEIRDKLQGLKGDKRLDISAIKGLQEQLDFYRQNFSRIPMGGGGQRVVAGTNIYITQGANGEQVINAQGGSAGTTIYQETPSGAIDGVNKSYTVAHTITTMLSLVINGQVLHPTTDYTFSGTTITLVNALAAELATTAFTATYV